MHLNTKLLLHMFARTYFSPGKHVLEVGPTQIPSELVSKVCKWDYTDIKDMPGLTFKSEPYQYPVPENTYDIVLSANVLEHVQYPWKLMTEFARVTKPGGYVVSVVPVSWPYHEWPMDCWRIYPEGMKALHESAGLTTVITEYGTGEQTFFDKDNIPADTTLISGRSFTWLTVEEKKQQLSAGMIEVAYDTIGIAQKPPLCESPVTHSLPVSVSVASLTSPLETCGTLLAGKEN